ncbi:MAG: hypothetical protein HY868_00645 [Chloroflexi bacterium]|nr:hypothetical protein [Chloroflexota bacterium]
MRTLFSQKVSFAVLRIFLLPIIFVVLIFVPVSAFAHGEPEITVTPDTIAPGGKITIKGETMGANEEFAISLEGVKFRADLGEVKSDADEKFTVQFTIPTNAPEGVYQVKAAGEDGDTVTTELTITANKSASVTEPTEPSMPSAEEDRVPRRRVSTEIIGLFAFALVSAGAGFLLVR